MCCIIAALTREHDGWKQACLRTSGERSRVQCLVPARSAGARHWTESAPRFLTMKSPGTMRITGRHRSAAEMPVRVNALVGPVIHVIQKVSAILINHNPFNSSMKSIIELQKTSNSGFPAGKEN